MAHTCLKNGLSVWSLFPSNTSCVGRSVVCGPRPRGKEELRPFIYYCTRTALHVFLRLPSLPLRVVASLVRVHRSLLLSETEAPSLAQNEQRTEALLARSASSSSSWHIQLYIVVALRGCGTTYITQHVSLRLGQRFRSYDHVSCV